MPRVSVLMPVYNASQFLKQAIDSIIAQILPDWELVIINDGSTDKSKSIIEEYNDRRIRYYENESNLGLIETLNKGFSLCSGEFIARMDADDISLSERLEKQVLFMQNNPHYAMCGGQAQIVDNNGTIKGKIFNLCDNDYLKINLLFSVPFVHPSVMIRSDIAKQYQFDKSFKHAEDYDLWCRIANNYKVANIADTILQYRWHTTNVSVANAKEQDEVKATIIKRELALLEISPSEEELQLHKISFSQYNAKEGAKPKKFSDFEGLSNWFKKIIGQNKIHKKYNNQALTAYLWSRWIVICIAQKRYLKILRPGFVTPSPNVYLRTIKLIAFLSKK